MTVTQSSPEWVSLSTVYHHVLESSPSPERAKIDIDAARKNGQLRFRAEQREHVARPGLRLNPGEQPPKNEPVITSDQPIPDGGYLTWDWERSHATRTDATTKSLFEYVSIAARRHDVLALWPASTAPAQGPAEAPKRGRKAEFKWDVIQFECARHFIDDGVPSNVSDFANEMLTWCQNQFREEGVPDHQTMRKKIKVWVEAYLRSSPRGE
jgi:hypothetical protein